MGHKIKATRLSSQVEESLRQSILKGEFPVGSRLPTENALIETFGVSRPSIREALLELERKGFLELRRGTAPVVTEPTPLGAMHAISDIVSALIEDNDNRRYFYELRVMLECDAIARMLDPATPTAREQIVPPLAAALEACIQAEGNPIAFRDADAAFHRTIVGLQENKVVIALHTALIEWGLFRPQSGENVSQIHDRVVRQHREIIHQIEAGNAQLAIVALRQHLTAQEDSTI